MNKNMIIVLGGEISVSQLKDIFYKTDDPVVIAADRGLEVLDKAGIKPDVIMGDFDSVDADVLDKYRSDELIRFDSVKDFTDGEAAVDMAVKSSSPESKVIILGGTGGRMDHTLANLQSAVFAQERGVQVHIQSPDTEIFTLASGELRLPRREDWSLSLFAADRCEGLSIRGAKYELEDAVLTSGFPLGVSNAWAEPEATISVERGVLLIILCKM